MSISRRENAVEKTFEYRDEYRRMPIAEKIKRKVTTMSRLGEDGESTTISGV
jgi:hypothetical protein